MATEQSEVKTDVKVVKPAVEMDVKLESRLKQMDEVINDQATKITELTDKIEKELKAKEVDNSAEGVRLRLKKTILQNYFVKTRHND